MGDTIKVEGWHCVPCCPDVVYEQPGKSTWFVDLHTMKLLLNLRLSVPRLMGVWIRLILSYKSKIPGMCAQTQLENYCCGWRARSKSTKLLCQVKKMMLLQPMNAKCVTSLRGIPGRCDITWLDMIYKVRMIGLHATKFSNLSSHVCCTVFETRMVSIQERTQTPWMGVLCGLRPKTRNQHTIVSWSRR